MINLPEKIKELREKRGYTVQQMAELLNYSPQAYSNWENKKRTISIQLIKSISTILGFKMIVENGDIKIEEVTSLDKGNCSTVDCILDEDIVEKFSTHSIATYWVTKTSWDKWISDDSNEEDELDIYTTSEVNRYDSDKNNILTKDDFVQLYSVIDNITRQSYTSKIFYSQYAAEDSYYLDIYPSMHPLSKERLRLVEEKVNSFVCDADIWSTINKVRMMLDGLFICISEHEDTLELYLDIISEEAGDKKISIAKCVCGDSEDIVIDAFYKKISDFFRFMSTYNIVRVDDINVVPYFIENHRDSIYYRYVQPFMY